MFCFATYLHLNFSPTQNGYTSHVSDNNTVYYNEDGQQVTAEENIFTSSEEYNDYLR